MATTCIDLKERFGRRFKVEYEESYHADHGDGARTADPWLMIVPCRYGHLYPFGGDVLAASVDGFAKVAGQLRRLPCCRVHQDGDFGELTVLFNAADFARVARIIRPRRRRQVSAVERERLRGMGFRKGAQARLDVQHAPRPCVAVPQADPGAVGRQTALFSLSPRP